MAKSILIYTNHFFPENFKVNEIAQLLSEEGNFVHVVTGIPNYPTGRIYEGYGLFKRSFEKQNDHLTIRRLPLIPRGNGSKFRLVLNYLSYFTSTLVYTFYLIFFKKKYEVVLVHHTSPVLISIPPIFYKWVKRSKNILWDLDMWPDTLKAIGIIKSERLIRLLEIGMKWIYAGYDQILLGSNGFLKKAKYRVSESKVQYFPNWAEKVFFFQNQSALPSAIKFPDGFTITYAGNVGEAQDFPNVLEAMKILKDHPISWIIVGDGRFKFKMEEEILKNNLERKVFFYGNHPIEFMPVIFQKSDVLFLSLKNEPIFSITVPAKLQAYMASAKPVAAMISGEGKDIIQDSQCGFVVESGDYKGFSEIVMKLFCMDQPLRLEMGSKGKDYYMKHFDLKNRVRQLDVILSNFN